MFENTQISIILYTILVIVAILIEVMIMLYLAGNWHFGKPMKPFLMARIARWKDPRQALFEVIDVTGHIYLDPAKIDTGTFQRPEHFRIKKTREPMNRTTGVLFGMLTIVTMGLIFTALYLLTPAGIAGSAGGSLLALFIPAVAQAGQPIRTEKIYLGGSRPQPKITPRSVYTINSVPTVLLLDLHPPLHQDIKDGINRLIENGITTHTDLIQWTQEHPEDILMPGYTYQSFTNIYNATRQKLEFIVTVGDVGTGITKNFNNDYKESLHAKDYNYKAKKKYSDSTVKYALVGLIILCIAVAFKIIYVTVYGGK